jgi:hypothetical protein
MLARTGRQLAAVAAAVAMTGCGGNTLGTLGDVLGSVIGTPAGAGGQGQVAAEIRAVDGRQQVIQVTTQEGQTGSVRFDRNTVVVYQQQQYPVTALERGDLVVLHLQDMQGTLYTPRIDVQQSVRDRAGTGTGTGVMQVAGRVAQVDQNAGAFVLQSQNGNVTISLPLNAPQATVDYFRRLRVGNNIRVEVTQSATGRVEVYRFL